MFLHIINKASSDNLAKVQVQFESILFLQFLDVSLQLPTEECHGICSTSDASLMILQSSRLTELNIGPRGQPIWSCNTDREIENRKRNERFGMAYDELTRMTYVCGKFDGDTSASICLISPEGR